MISTKITRTWQAIIAIAIVSTAVRIIYIREMSATIHAALVYGAGVLIITVQIRPAANVSTKTLPIQTPVSRAWIVVVTLIVTLAAGIVMSTLPIGITEITRAIVRVGAI